MKRTLTDLATLIVLIATAGALLGAAVWTLKIPEHGPTLGGHIIDGMQTAAGLTLLALSLGAAVVSVAWAGLAWDDAVDRAGR